MRRPHDSRLWPGSRVLLAAACVTMLCGCANSRQLSVGAAARPDGSQAESGIRRDQPPNAKTLYSMADILATQGKDAECEFVLRRCIHEYPRFIPAYNSLAELQMRQSRLNEAADTLSQALEIRPHDPVLVNNLGMCFLLRRQYAKALEHFTRAAGLVPESEKYRANMATALGLLGRHEESLALLQQVLPRDKALHNAEVLRKAREKAAGPAPSAEG